MITLDSLSLDQPLLCFRPAAAFDCILISNKMDRLREREGQSAVGFMIYLNDAGDVEKRRLPSLLLPAWPVTVTGCLGNEGSREERIFN